MNASFMNFFPKISFCFIEILGSEAYKSLKIFLPLNKCSFFSLLFLEKRKTHSKELLEEFFVYGTLFRS